MARDRKELTGADAEIATLFEGLNPGIDFDRPWKEIRDEVLEYATHCLDAYEKYKSETLEKIPPVRAYHFNNVDRRAFLAFDYVKKQRVADEAREMFEAGSFTSPEKQKEKLVKLAKQLAELKKQLGVDVDIDLASILG